MSLGTNHCVLLLILLVVCMFNQQHGVSCLVAPKQPYFLWPNPSTGEATVYFQDGSSKPVETLWVGYSAWDNIAQVKTRIKEIISKGSVPFIQSYSFGDNGLRGQYSKAVEFDKQVSLAIGSNFAFVNLETEWDVEVVLNLFKTKQGTKCLEDRVNLFKTNSPNAVVVSSPGLWKSASTYSFFTSIDQSLNARAMIMHVTNVYDTFCSKRSDGTFWTNGANSLNSAITSVMDTITGNLNKMEKAWGVATPMEWIIADAGVTSCGWGEDGQNVILNEIVKNLDCLYKGGFRGMNLRNSGPGNIAERAMGINNEGLFTFTKSVSSVQTLKSGLARAKKLFIDGANIDCVQVEPKYSVSVVDGSNNYWAQLEISPSSSLTSVVLNCNNGSTKLGKSSWSESQYVKGLSKACPIGSTAEVVINGNEKISLTYSVGQSGSSNK